MATKKSSETKVTRISASDSAPKKSVKKASAVKSTKVKREKKTRNYGVLGKIGGYFKGAWFELRQVHWPTRSATWGLTGAVLVFSLFFVVFITLLDAAFKYLFEIILK